MIGAWVLVALIEWAASRAEREPAIPVFAAGPPEPARADPAWFVPPVEHTLLDASGDDPVTAVTRLPPVPPGTIPRRPSSSDPPSDARPSHLCPGSCLRESTVGFLAGALSHCNLHDLLPRRAAAVVARDGDHAALAAFIIAASYVFYGWWDWRFVFLLAGCTVWNHLLAIQIFRAGDRRSRKALADPRGRRRPRRCSATSSTTTSSSARPHNLATRSGMGLPLSTRSIVLPVGISFFTFMAITTSSTSTAATSSR